jgi:uncharacterized protein (DUF58 family)
MPEGRLPTMVRLQEVVSLAATARAAVRASGRTAASGAAAIRYLSRTRTSDRAGDRVYQMGDPISLLIWRELALRGRASVRTFREFAEARSLVVLDASRSLLGNLTTGCFAVQLAAVLLGLATCAKSPARLAILGAGRAAVSPPIRRASQLGVALGRLATVEAESVPHGSLVPRLAEVITPPRSNVNAFVVLAPGYSADTQEALMRMLGGLLEAATIFPVVDQDDLKADETVVTDPESGRRVELAEPAGQALERAFRTAVGFGRMLGVRVEPLVVANADADLLTLLEWLAWL